MTPCYTRHETAPGTHADIPHEHERQDMSEEREDRTAHWGTCEDEDCLTSIVIYPHPDAIADLPDEDDWDTSPLFMDCPVCGSGLDFGGIDHPADILRNY